MEVKYMEKEIEKSTTQKFKLSLNNLSQSPRLDDIKIEDDRFFAYEKQKSHN
jgi:hypothetical protein